MISYRNVTWLSLILVLLVSCASDANLVEPPDIPTLFTDELSSSAIRFVNLLVKEDYVAMTTYFTAEVKRGLTEEQFKQAWTTLISMFGNYKEIISTTKGTEGGNDIVIVKCQFEKEVVDIKVVFDGDRLVAGFWVNRAAESNVSYNTPDYVKLSSFDEIDVRVGSDEWVLPGTLSIPKGLGPFPVVVLVHGSGPNDRDETLGPNKPFKDLAWGLASKGIAVLRYEKRTKEYATKILASLMDFTVKQEVIDDVLYAIDLLQNTSRIDSKKVFVLGHSLGGMLIPRIGHLTQDAAGLIVFAGATRYLQDIILDQVHYLYSLVEKPSEEQEKQLKQVVAELAKINDPKLSELQPSEIIFGVPPSYCLDLRFYEPAKEAITLSQPLLILQGGRDYQSTNEDYEGWKQALSERADVCFKLYPDLNHLFMSGKGKITPSEYLQPNHVESVVIEDIANWVKAH